MANTADIFESYSKYWLLIFARNWPLYKIYSSFNNPWQTSHLINIMANSAHIEPLCILSDQYCPLKHLYCIVVFILLVCLPYRSQEDSDKNSLSHNTNTIKVNDQPSTSSMCVCRRENGALFLWYKCRSSYFSASNCSNELRLSIQKWSAFSKVVRKAVKWMLDCVRMKMLHYECAVTNRLQNNYSTPLTWMCVCCHCAEVLSDWATLSLKTGVKWGHIRYTCSYPGSKSCTRL